MKIIFNLFILLLFYTLLPYYSNSLGRWILAGDNRSSIFDLDYALLMGSKSNILRDVEAIIARDLAGEYLAKDPNILLFSIFAGNEIKYLNYGRSRKRYIIPVIINNIMRYSVERSLRSEYTCILVSIKPTENRGRIPIIRTYKKVHKILKNSQEHRSCLIKIFN